MEFDLDPHVISDLERILAKVCTLARTHGKLSGFCIGSTRKPNENGLYFSPIRFTNQVVAGSVIVYGAHHAEWIARRIDGHVDVVFVDSEKKIGAATGLDAGAVVNVEREVYEVVKKSKVLTFKGNDLTVDSIENLIVGLISEYPRGLGGKKCAIIGAGNVGSKLALKLVERGMDIILVRRNLNALSVIVEALNLIKPPATRAKITAGFDAEIAAVDADLLIGLTPGTAAISAAMVGAVRETACLIDVGKGSFTPEALEFARRRNLPVYRTDIRPGFEGHSSMALSTDALLKAYGETVIDGVRVVSGGLLAGRDVVVVDDIRHPTVVFGIANGHGDFIRSPNPTQQSALDAVERHIQKLVLLQ